LAIVSLRPPPPPPRREKNDQRTHKTPPSLSPNPPKNQKTKKKQVDDDPTNKRAIIARSTSRGGVPRPRGRAGGRGGSATSTKLIVIMVGLPGRGKTFLCNKLRCYLSWLGHTTAHFNVGQYRRMQRGSTGEVQDAAFFDATNKAGVEARNRALDAALADLMAYLESENGQVAIFDATNSTVERRQKLVGCWEGR
jgi:6-phosphofructo-2-kinase/fructose-2,6-biphosphatase